jgi:hypothetical protein
MLMISVIRQSRRSWLGPARLLLVLLAAAVQPASQAQADLPVREFQRLVQGIADKDTSRMGALQYFLRGLLDGIAASNAAYVEAGAKPLVCVPHDPHPPFDEIVVAIQQELERGRGYWVDDPSRPVEPVALIALRRQWPCK